MGWVPKLHPPRDVPKEGLVFVAHAETRPVVGAGPGDALAATLKRMGIWSRTNCRCETHVRAMNTNGLEWCLQHIDTIVEWLRDGAKERGLPFSPWIATRLVRVVLWRHARKGRP